MIPYSCQDIDSTDIEAVTQVLASDFLTQGAQVPAFERALARRVQAREAIAVNSGTSALHLACLALSVGPGDRVWTSPISFVASANCARYCGAEVDFVDIDPRTGNLHLEALERRLADAALDGCLPKVLIPVHYAGQSCDMRVIARLVNPYGVRIIEDASHALGADYEDTPVGCGRYSDITVFSFHPVKMITCGEGGALLTNSLELAESARLLRSHGVTRDPARVDNLEAEPWRYEQHALGFNYRMTDLQAALGLSQLARLDAFLAERRQRARRYQRAFEGTPVSTLHQLTEAHSAWHLMSVLVPAGIRAEVFRRLRQDGIGVNVHYLPIYRQPYYQQLGFPPGYCPRAEAFYQSELSIPLHTRLSDSDQALVIERLLHHVEALT
ncbi:UDP-4-amino-4,6-dideoxy-N-acetyl-beta-L-altrosamine transaminase [Marinobacter xestospongiae]|uniref:UDP-4-amino-4, 6-dideoxy-N-acetyl-beta-L-altrosamine transaminase n=1 Tax=Marinobacter xestospongiae TaxID=994319 RepID=A0ABU3W0T4_9GAMM|nr:UDP-4-amino-4,6-dideoxy-N-acetyl-beta-L-altrosamine transaminase [Marinobacter xestospongiae]MDV2079955.1 UDP-4-amino-4,6-dideoxy-N-acetyl-beta-L-altrosamine transaminase [Marinobacter xestospongiae]